MTAGPSHEQPDTPRRIQLSRKKGYRKPEGAIVVARPSRWGNPYFVHSSEIVQHDDGRDWWIPGGGARQFAVESYRTDLVNGRLPVTVADVERDLAGHDLACWCKPDQLCHGDVLLEIANAAAGVSS